MMMRMMPVLAALDQDKDGILSKAEIANATAALKTLDKNKDGKLDQEEMRPDFGAMRGRGGFRPGGEGGGRPQRPAGDTQERMRGFVTRILNDNDKDKDGKLTKSELPERMQGMLERGDKNKDGAIDKAELEELFANVRRGGERGQGRRPEGGREGGDRADRPRRPARPDGN